MTTTDESLPDLLRNVRHNLPAIRLRSVKALGRLGPVARPAAATLAAATDDPDPKVREAAAQAIGQLGPDAVSVLAGLLTHQDKYVRRNAVWGLGRLGPAARPYLGHLCESLKDEDARTASGAAQAIGAMGETAADAVPKLAEAMRGTNIVLCRLAAKALSQVGRPALATLVQHLKHHDPFVRGEAAVALGWIGPPAAMAVRPLIDMVRAARPNQRPATAHLASVHTPPTAVVNKPSDPPTVEDAARAAAIQALGRIGAAAAPALPDLEAAYRDPSDPVRRAAELAVRQIRGLV